MPILKTDLKGTPIVMNAQYAVVGNPINHSRSPSIHTMFAEQEGSNIDYTKLLAPLEQFTKTVRDFFDQGGMGLNITVPFKQEAYSFADQLTERAQISGSVNTLKKLTDGTILGDTTDGEGFIKDLTQNLNTPIHQNSILILGAGGAVASILAPILAHNPKDITLANRTLSRAQELADRFESLGKIHISSFENIKKHPFDLIINGTSTGLQQTQLPIPRTIFSDTSLAYDLFYAAHNTPFLDFAEQNGCLRLADGLGMLVEQAAESYFLWRNFKPQTDVVIETIRQQLY